MKISYLGHSCFFIEGKYSVVTDPYQDIGYPLKRVKCDFVLSSHDHFDHNAVKEVDYDTAVTFDTPVSLASDVNLTAIDSFHDECFGKKRGKNRIYKFTVDGVRFTHLGDLGEKFSNSLVEKIGETDVLFIPVGGVYTIDCKEAALFAKAIAPKIVIPMHYKTPRSTVGVGGYEEFIKEFSTVKFLPREAMIPNKLPEDLSVYVFDSKDF